MRWTLAVTCLALACTEPALEAPIRSAVDGLSAELVTAEAAEQTRITEPIAVAEPEPAEDFEVQIQSGESLALYGRWLESNPEKLALENGIDPYGKLKIGQRLRLPLGELTPARFEEQRIAWRKARVARYLKKRGGVHEVIDHKVRRGETVLGVARRHGRLPHWVMRHYNPKRDLNTLSVGDTIRVPITNDRVVSRR